MNWFVLYLYLVKATLTSFSGLTSLPVVRHDLVETRRVLTDWQLNAAVAAGRTAPGPNGLYVVSVGYFVDGIPGAIAGYLAMITPAFLILPLLRYVGKRAEQPRIKGAIQGVTIAAAALIISATVPLAQDSITGWLPAAIAIASFAIIAFTKIDTFWVMAASAIIGVASFALTLHS
jgi:chromate transporter